MKVASIDWNGWKATLLLTKRKFGLNQERLFYQQITREVSSIERKIINKAYSSTSLEQIRHKNINRYTKLYKSYIDDKHMA